MPLALCSGPVASSANNLYLPNHFYLTKHYNEPRSRYQVSINRNQQKLDSGTLSQVSFLRTRFHLPRHLGNITQNKFSFKISRFLGRDYASNADREDQFDRYIHSADVRWNALMSGLSVLIVLGTVPDRFEMFNSIIGTFHHTCAGTLLRSSLARLRLLSRYSIYLPRYNQLEQLRSPTPHGTRRGDTDVRATASSTVNNT